jgi:hypothetical protein
VASSRGGELDHDREAGASDSVCQGDSAGTLLQQRANDRKPKSGSGGTIGRGDTVEAIEYTLAMFGRDAWPVVGNSRGIAALPILRWYCT